MLPLLFRKLTGGGGSTPTTAEASWLEGTSVLPQVPATANPEPGWVEGESGRVPLGQYPGGTGGQTLTGQVVSFAWGVVAATVITATTLTGSAPSFSLGVTAATPQPTVTLAGSAPAQTYAVTAATPQPTVTIAGSAPALTFSVSPGTLSVAGGPITLNGSAPAFTFTVTAATPQPTVTIAGSAPAFTYAVSPATVQPSITLTGSAPAFTYAVTAATPSAVVTLAGSAPTIQYTVSAGTLIVAGSTITLNGDAPAFTYGVGAGSLVVEGQGQYQSTGGGGSDMLPLRVGITDLRKRTVRVHADLVLGFSGHATVRAISAELPTVYTEPLDIPVIPEPAPVVEAPKPAPEPAKPAEPELDVRVLPRTVRVHGGTPTLRFGGSAPVTGLHVAMFSGRNDPPPSRLVVLGRGGIAFGGQARVTPVSYLAHVRQDDEDVIQLLLNTSDL